MTQITPKLRLFARSLILHEATVNPSASAQRATILPAVDKLRSLLEIFMGRAGYHALIFRALVLAQEEARCLCDVKITADGSLTNHSGTPPKPEDDDWAKGGEVLLARLIDLLVAFIGEVMTLRLVRELWPDLPKDIDFNQANEYEQFN